VGDGIGVGDGVGVGDGIGVGVLSVASALGLLREGENSQIPKVYLFQKNKTISYICITAQ
jgi:hypothetical protein